MTRRSDLMCEDLFNCDHELTIPISDGEGEVVSWQCPCGHINKSVEQIQEENKKGERT